MEIHTTSQPPLPPPPPLFNVIGLTVEEFNAIEDALYQRYLASESEADRSFWMAFYGRRYRS